MKIFLSLSFNFFLNPHPEYVFIDLRERGREKGRGDSEREERGRKKGKRGEGKKGDRGISIGCLPYVQDNPLLFHYIMNIFLSLRFDFLNPYQRIYFLLI